MIIFISGGVRSGKSSLAEFMASTLSIAEKVYLATSESGDEEMKDRIAKHKEDRKDKKYRTIEKSMQILDAIPELKKNDTVIFDCLGNLLANEMYFDPSIRYDDQMIASITEKITFELDQIAKNVHLLIIVSNEIFSDGIQYDIDAEPFLMALADLHRNIAEKAEVVIECVHGRKIIYKNEMKGILENELY